ncbi:MAG: hypothetical protein AB2989_04875 [Candidatus Symbiodolus clandestinus]
MNGITAVGYSPAYQRIQPSEAITPSASGGPFKDGFKQLYGKMDQLSQEAQAYYDTLAEKTKASQEASEILRDFSSRKAQEFLEKQAVPPPEGVASWYKVDDPGVLKQALEDYKTAQTDFVAESQLKIQRTMQTYNTVVTLTNSLQKVLAELNKSLIQGMR